MPIFYNEANDIIRDSYSGVQEIEFDQFFVDQLHKNKFIDIIADYNENEYLVIKSCSGSSCLARYSNKQIKLLNTKLLDKACQIKARNKEQYFVLDALMDDALRVVSLTGKAGSGKTYVALAAAIAQMESNKYDRLILTRPTSQVGRRDLGTLPGDAEEKIMPYMINFMCNLQSLFGTNVTSSINMDYIFSKYRIEVVPMQLLRGASFANSLVIFDECQVCNFHEMLTVGTRISENSKLVLMGDLKQRDEQIKPEQTGLHRFINSDAVKKSKIAASVTLVKSERGEVSELFSTVFDAE